jgi:hypothetical protein
VSSEDQPESPIVAAARALVKSLHGQAKRLVQASVQLVLWRSISSVYVSAFFPMGRQYTIAIPASTPTPAGDECIPCRCDG